MKRVMAITSVILLVLACSAFSQQDSSAAKDAEGTPQGSVQESQAPAPSQSAPQSEDLSIYGEVQSVDAASNSLKVQYYDYDTDEEKTADIISDKDTAIEGAKTVGEIKQNDWVDVTYNIRDGKNAAKKIAIEKEEELPPETGGAGEAVGETPESE